MMYYELLSKMESIVVKHFIQLLFNAILNCVLQLFKNGQFLFIGIMIENIIQRIVCI